MVDEETGCSERIHPHFEHSLCSTADHVQLPMILASDLGSTTACVTHTSPEPGTKRRSIAAFLTQTWLGNFIALLVFILSLLTLGLTAYSSAVQIVYARWTAKNDLLQTCLAYVSRFQAGVFELLLIIVVGYRISIGALQYHNRDWNLATAVRYST